MSNPRTKNKTGNRQKNKMFARGRRGTYSPYIMNQKNIDSRGRNEPYTPYNLNKAITLLVKDYYSRL